MKDVDDDDDDDDDDKKKKTTTTITCCNLTDVYMFGVISPCKNCISPKCTSATNSI